jgi:hypothetical protein
MTTFTTEDRILAEKDGSFTINVEGGTVTTGFKELTDEQIKAVYGEYFDVENCDWLQLQCIQAILKKARE